MNMNARLCYVADNFAYFTTCDPFERQWGDDWNDAPYEHNAGEPYDWREYMGANGLPEYEVVKVAYDGDLVTPDYDSINSSYSVEQINAGSVPWLRTWYSGDKPVAIGAGCSLAAFIELVEASGGTVYLPRQAVPA